MEIPLLRCRARGYNCRANLSRLPICGDGRQVRDWLFVEDHAAALAAILERGRAGETYAVGGNSEQTNLDVVGIICDLLDRHRPRNAGSYPGYVFTGEPLKLAAGHFGLGHGSGAHAPDEYYIIESTNPKIQDFDGATMSFVEYLYELAKQE